jgi:hypothetical protein
VFAITHNLNAVIADLKSIPLRITLNSSAYFQRKQNEIYEQGREIVEQVVYIAFPEGSYTRRGTSTSNLGILNSIVAFPNASSDGVLLGITSASSAIADTVPKTAVGRGQFDTYAGWMITGGGFLEPLGTDVRDFLDVWRQFFSITLPYDFMKEVVIPSI